VSLYSLCHGFLGCDAVYCCGRILTFRRIMLLNLQGEDGGVTNQKPLTFNLHCGENLKSHSRLRLWTGSHSLSHTHTRARVHDADHDVVWS
jgi:hypothetical protein